MSQNPKRHLVKNKRLYILVILTLILSFNSLCIVNCKLYLTLSCLEKEKRDRIYDCVCVCEIILELIISLHCRTKVELYTCSHDMT